MKLCIKDIYSALTASYAALVQLQSDYQLDVIVIENKEQALVDIKKDLKTINSLMIGLCGKIKCPMSDEYHSDKDFCKIYCDCGCPDGMKTCKEYNDQN